MWRTLVNGTSIVSVAVALAGIATTAGQADASLVRISSSEGSPSTTSNFGRINPVSKTYTTHFTNNNSNSGTATLTGEGEAATSITGGVARAQSTLDVSNTTNQQRNVATAVTYLGGTNVKGSTPPSVDITFNLEFEATTNFATTNSREVYGEVRLTLDKPDSASGNVVNFSPPPAVGHTLRVGVNAAGNPISVPETGPFTNVTLNQSGDTWSFDGDVTLKDVPLRTASVGGRTLTAYPYIAVLTTEAEALGNSTGGAKGSIKVDASRSLGIKGMKDDEGNSITTNNVTFAVPAPSSGLGGLGLLGLLALGFGRRRLQRA